MSKTQRIMSILIKEIKYQDAIPIRKVVMYPLDSDNRNVCLEEDPSGTHFGLFVKESGDNNSEKLVSIVSLFLYKDPLKSNSTVAQFRKFATLQQYQNQGYGSKLLDYMIKHSQENSVDLLWCNARTSALSIYSKFSLQPCDKPYIKNNIEFVRLERKLK
ncbi:hypothetical protein DLAC_07939 [Tieghemostelium lacteum]|uniref:N-acetyltransferase domain-containing protein n=1 Tax=Tieghemostelium lacteum TaxID=361077 RepID=A0A151ZAS7_TIELA|nr:hypothetical protein DLAC_07939 [Tieghemostelium lacteum]|eukprot:KYQ91038.1 hypothetical protein DLAC_07939 [Tieghemostelium lacteum]